MTFAVDQDRTGEAALAGAHQGGAASPGPLKRGSRYWYLIALPAVLMAYLASGFFVVGPDQRAVVRRFGAS